MWIGFIVFCWDKGVHIKSLDIEDQIGIVGAAMDRIQKAEHEFTSEVAFLLGGHHADEHVHLTPDTVDAHSAAAIHIDQLRGSVNHAHKDIQEVLATDKAEGKDEIHVIFSTDCSPYQDWQTLTLFYSATVVGQKGPITRIASGCDDTKKRELTSLYAKLYPSYFVHFTPDFKKDAKTNKKYDFYNKPWGVKHWLEHANPPVPTDIIIALLDPDMIFLRPITIEIKNQKNAIWNKNLKKSEMIDKVGAAVYPNPNPNPNPNSELIREKEYG